MLVSLRPKDLMIIENWTVTHVISESNFANSNKFLLIPFPNFDPIHFPFVICPGKQGINIINVKEHRMQVLINTVFRSVLGYNGTFFQTEDSNHTLHFAINVANDKNETEWYWYDLKLKSDIINILQRHGRLPHSTLTA